MNEKIKILVFAHDALLYGASRSLLTLIEGLKNNYNIEFLVLLPSNGVLENIFEEKNISFKTIYFPVCFTISKPKNWLQSIKQQSEYKKDVNTILPNIMDVARQFSPDIIYTNTSVVSIGFTVAKKLNVPHVWHIREFGDLDYNFTYLPSRRKVEKLIRQNKHNIFVSKNLRTHWCGKILNNSLVIYNGVASSATNYSPRSFPVSDRNFNIGLLGALTSGKGQGIAIQAIIQLKTRFPQLKLFLYGEVSDNNFRKELLKIIDTDNGEGTVTIMPFENNQEKIYSNLDLLLNCSVMEGFGRTIIEAMERGIPVIANASGGPKEIIRHKENGMLYHQTVESLQDAIIELIENKELYERIAQAGLIEAKEVYSEKKYIESVANVFKTIIKNDKSN